MPEGDKSLVRTDGQDQTRVDMIDLFERKRLFLPELPSPQMSWASLLENAMEAVGYTDRREDVGDGDQDDEEEEEEIEEEAWRDTENRREDTDYELKDHVGRGGFGEVWMATRHGTSDLFVIKRLLVEKGEYVRMSGYREIEFSQQLLHAPRHIARFVEYMEEEQGQLWIVFRYEGVSLNNYLYTTSEANPNTQFTTVEPSAEWRALREDAGGGKLKDLFRQILEAVATAHTAGIVNRSSPHFFSSRLLCFPVHTRTQHARTLS
jgi:hypothetical protein